MGDVPFRHVFIHGLVRDEHGQKMSKSKGNGIDPLELVETYGADALRFTICALTGVGRDIKLSHKRVENYRTFITKLWNAARFCEMNGIVPQPEFKPEQAQLALCRWILVETASTLSQATQALENYRFDEYASACYRFVWNRFCDWFLEFAKPVFAEQDSSQAAEIRAVAAYVLGVILRLLQPVIPFVTDTLWHSFGFGEQASLINAPWPEVFLPQQAVKESYEECEQMIRIITEIRTVRSELNIPPSRLVPVILRGVAACTQKRIVRWEKAICRMARVDEISSLTGESPRGAIQLLVDDITLLLPLAGIVDIEAEKTRLQKEYAKATEEAQKTAKKLDNENFINKAHPDIVQEMRHRLESQHHRCEQINAALAHLQAC